MIIRKILRGHGRTQALQLPALLIAVMMAGGIAACDGRVSKDPQEPVVGTPPTPINVDLKVRVLDITSTPVAGASITVSTGNVQQETTSDENGGALFAALPSGDATISVVMPDFEAYAQSITLSGSAQSVDVRLSAIGSWAVGRAIVLGTRAIELASDGSALTFSADIAVVGENSQALETLTAGSFTLVTIDCGWGGPRDCASDAAGNATHNFKTDGVAQAFEYRPGGARSPWLAAIMVERGPYVFHWDERVTSLKSFFAGLGGNDLASLLSIQASGDTTTLTQFGPFTSDGSIYLDEIDGLAVPVTDEPATINGLLDVIQMAAAAASNSAAITEATVVTLAGSDIATAEMDQAAELARQLGVHLSTVVRSGSNHAFPEMAVRTGGFASEYGDPRQLGMIFAALDAAIAGTLPFYRVQFQLTGPTGTFVPSGNASVHMRIDVPSDVINGGVWTSFDVAIP